jgi:hypothetical protein
MNKRFVVLIENETDETYAALKAIVQGKYGWWHWIKGSWLITSSAPETTASSLRDEVRTATAGRNIVVLQIAEGGTWAGFGPQKPPKDMFSWIKRNWK